jgi:hypothetical protein
MAQADMTSFAAFFKECYSDWKIPFRSIRKSALLMMLNHKTNAYGSDQVVPLELGSGGGTSNDFATAQSLATGTSNVKFTVPWQKLYSVVEIDSHAIDFSKGPGAVEEIVDREVESKSKRHLNLLCTQLYGDGTGKLAQSSTSDAANTSVITLTNRFDAAKFQMNDVITVAAAGAGSARTGTATITKVDRINGTLTFAGGVTGSIAAFTPGDYIYAPGTFGNNYFMGLSGYLPGKSLTSTAFMGQDRTQDSVELAGFSHDFSNSSVSIEEAIVTAATEISNNDGNPDYFFCHPNDWQKIQGSLTSQARVDQTTFEKEGVQFGFPTIRVVCGNADVAVLADPFCPQSEGFLITSDSWLFKTAGEIGKFISQGTGNGDSGLLRVRDGADTMEARMVTRGNLICKTPRFNSHLYLPVQIGR